jgi:hypothetical protein
MIRVVRTEARKGRVHEPERIVDIRHFMNLNVTRDVHFARQKARIVFVGWFELLGDRGHIAEIPNLMSRANRQSLTPNRQSHGLLKGAKVRVNNTLVTPQKDELAGLICGNGQRNPKRIQNLRKRSSMNAAQCFRSTIRFGSRRIVTHGVFS